MNNFMAKYIATTIAIVQNYYICTGRINGVLFVGQ